MKRIAVKFFRQSGVACLWMWLALGSLQALAATSATNTATIAPPPGITDSVGGCDLATPPNCTGNNISTASIDVWATTASKTAAPASGTAVLPGSLITYTLSVNVTGAATTADVQLTDTLSAGLSFGSVLANAGGFTANTASNPLIFTLPSGAAVGVHTVQYTARVAANATGSVSNSVVGGGCSPAAPCTTTHTIGALSLVKALESESGTQRNVAEPGESLVYSITLSNTSGTAASYNLTDTLGAGLSYVSSAPAGVNAGQTTTWANLSVPANGSLIVRVTATVNTPITVPSVSNLAKPTGGPDPTCPSVGNCIVTPTASGVTVAKRANPASGSIVVPGQSISYTLTAVVTGGTTTTPTVLSDTLGAGLTFGAVSSPGAFAAGGAGNTRTFTLPVGTPAGTYAVTYTATVNAGAADGTVNNAVTGATCATPGGCGTTHPVGTVTLVKTLLSESGTRAGIAEPGETLVYRITLTNPTAAPATYNLTDTMSAGLSYVGSSNGGVNTGQNTTWTGLSVPGGGSLAVTVTATVSTPITVPSISNLAKPNLVGVPSGNANRGRNFILKVDPSTLPDGAEFTTDNPLVRRITPGLPARFDFGVKLPVEPMRGASEQIDIALGEVIFAPGSAELRTEDLPVVEKIAARVNEYAGGELLIRADGEAEALAMDRVQAVERALQPLLSPAAAAAVRITARMELTQPVVSVVGVSHGQVVLGTVLFDTDKSEIRPQFRELIAQLAKRLNERGGGVVGLVGHADRRASDAYNLALGLRRARAVYEALAEQLNPEVRAKVRVETLNNAPAAVRASRK